MLCWFILIFSVLFTPPAFGLEFINPPPNNKAVTSEDSDFSKNSLFFLGSTVTIQWTSPPAGVRTSLTMFQQKGKTFLQPFEYLTALVDSSAESFEWTVQTSKDLSVSPMFFFTIFTDGATGGSSNSRFFNITAKAGEQPAPKSESVAPTTLKISSSTSSSTTSTSTSMSTDTSATSTTIPTSSSADKTPPNTSTGLSASSTPPVTPSNTEFSPARLTADSSSTAVPVSSSGGLNIKAKIGLGCGIPAAIILGVTAGWFIFGRRKAPAQAAVEPPTYEAMDVEKLSPQPYPYQLSSESIVAPIIFELHDNHQRNSAA